MQVKTVETKSPNSDIPTKPLSLALPVLPEGHKNKIRFADKFPEHRVGRELGQCGPYPSPRSESSPRNQRSPMTQDDRKPTIEELYEMGLISEDDYAKLTLTKGTPISTKGNFNTAPHMEVYDRLLRDLHMKRMNRTQQSSGPKNSLPALPKRPIRKKWGLSGPYSATHQEDMELDRQANRLKLTEEQQKKCVGGQAKSRHQSERKERLQYSVSYPGAAADTNNVKQMPKALSYSHELPYISGSRPPSVLSRSYTYWGSGFRAPSKNDYYDDEVRRQRSLTAMLRSSELPVVHNEAQVYPPELTDSTKYITFCHSAVLEKKTESLSPDTNVKRAPKKYSLSSLGIIAVSSHKI